MPQEFLDFELSVDPVPDGYDVSVVRSPAGEAKEAVAFPYGGLELENRLKDLEIALLRFSGGPRRRVLSKEEASVKELGSAFFDFLLAGDVRSLFYESRREAERRGLGLRLKLRLDAPELAALPWEFLHDPRNDDYLCLASDTSLVRYLPVAQSPRPLTVTPPLRILGMVADPAGYPRLDVALEKQRMETALATLQSDGLVELSWLEGGSWRTLQREMRRSDWHIFHFIGHGSFDRDRDEGFLAFADARGEADRIYAGQLALLLDKRSLRLALLNACDGAKAGQLDIFSSTAAALARRSVPAVLAMQYEISDAAALEFSRSFYEALADGLPVDAAVTEARRSLSFARPNSVEWGTPVLYLRAVDGALFEWGETERQKAKGDILNLSKEEGKSGWIPDNVVEDPPTVVQRGVPLMDSEPSLSVWNENEDGTEKEERQDAKGQGSAMERFVRWLMSGEGENPVADIGVERQVVDSSGLPALETNATDYGVTIETATVAPGTSYWRVIRVHHLSPEENKGRHHIYINAIKTDGGRAFKSQAHITWAGGEYTVTLDKPLNEPAANFPMFKWQKCTVEMKGMPSDKVRDISSSYPDEPNPDGSQSGNTLFHHSFLVVFQEVTAS